MLMSKIVNNDVSKDATIVTCLLSDRYDRIWEIRGYGKCRLPQKEEVHDSFSLGWTYFIAKENVEHLWDLMEQTIK